MGSLGTATQMAVWVLAARQRQLAVPAVQAGLAEAHWLSEVQTVPRPLVAVMHPWSGSQVSPAGHARLPQSNPQVPASGSRTWPVGQAPASALTPGAGTQTSWPLQVHPGRQVPASSQGCPFIGSRSRSSEQPPRVATSTAVTPRNTRRRPPPARPPAAT